MSQSIFFFVYSNLLPICLILGPFVYFGLNKYLLVNDPNAVPPEKATSTSKETKDKKPSEKEADTGIKPSSLFGSSSNESNKTLPAPLDTPYTPEQLADHDGTDKDLPVLLAVKGKVFDVSGNRVTYSPGGGYHIFSGKDASRALGISSLKKADCIDDLSGMTEQQLKVLDDWFGFFEKRYPIVGVVKK